MRTKISIFLFGLTGLMVAATLWTTRPANPPPVAWPSKRIVRIIAKLQQEPKGSPFAADFEIEPSGFGKIIEALSPAIPFDPTEIVPIGPDLVGGSITIKYAERPAVDVMFYLEGQNPLVFKMDGKFFLRGGRYNPHLEEDHRRIYGPDLSSEALDESYALRDLLKSTANEEGRRRGQK